MNEALAADVSTALEPAREQPRPLSDLCAAAALVQGRPVSISESSLIRGLEQEDWGGPIHQVMKRLLSRWDHIAEAAWTHGTPPNTAERRAIVYDALAISADLRGALDRHAPFFPTTSRLVVISDKFVPWYTPERQAAHSFYWSHFESYLREVRRWPEESLVDLARSTSEVVERVSDPYREEIYQAKGLVVGYVQSGKTANITGVIAKAADAGYRLIIVLSGSTNLLRAQTQRRIDKELVGKELIQPFSEVEDESEIDYVDDSDWDEFVSHGGRPSQLGAFDWTRLTGERGDYQRLRAGIQSLEFEPRDQSKAFNHPDNLHVARAKLMVVKKSAPVLRRVAKDLALVAPRLDNVPALVIDDESDLASVNTVRPSSEEVQRRSAINEQVVSLLGRLRRAQYVGYTATPFANVFIDPDDAEDLFPKDFILSLPRPKDYMGSSDFHDLGGVAEGSERDPAVSNYAAYVRNLSGDDSDPANLQRAIDSFVLAGAIKLFRKAKWGERGIDTTTLFRHHTMLVHSSHRLREHAAMARRVRATLAEAGYEAGDGLARLELLFNNDFRPVSNARVRDVDETDTLGAYPVPRRFSQLRTFIGETLTRLWSGEDPVVIVNGTKEDPDFEIEPMWKVLVGGTKLSRGYTVEGLTISYFRRPARAVDTLMQMGRWFGFRQGYRDLVRLFIDRGTGRNFDIYEAFEAICRDEEAFRQELERYVTNNGDRIRPIDVPPLVASHLPWMPPTARNKMFNAVIRFKNFGGEWAQPTLAPINEGDKTWNEDLFRGFVEKLDLETRVLEADDAIFQAHFGRVEPSRMADLLTEYRWQRPGVLERELEFLKGSGEDPEIDDWLFLAPQLKRPGRWGGWPTADPKFAIRYRARTDLGRVKVYTEPDHILVSEAITGKSRVTKVNEVLHGLQAHRRGVMLFYPLTHHNEAAVRYPSPVDPRPVTPRLGT